MDPNWDFRHHRLLHQVPSLLTADNSAVDVNRKSLRVKHLALNSTPHHSPSDSPSSLQRAVTPATRGHPIFFQADMPLPSPGSPPAGQVLMLTAQGWGAQPAGLTGQGFPVCFVKYKNPFASKPKCTPKAQNTHQKPP